MREKERRSGGGGGRLSSSYLVVLQCRLLGGLNCFVDVYSGRIDCLSKRCMCFLLWIREDPGAF